MEYNSADSKIELLVSKWEKRTYFLIIFLGLFFIALVIEPILEQSIRGFLLMFFGSLYIFWKIIIKSTLAEARAINRIISSVRITNSKIEIVTMPLSSIFGLINKNPIYVEMEMSSLISETPRPNWPLNNKYLESAFILKKDGQEYYLLVGF